MRRVLTGVMPLRRTPALVIGFCVVRTICHPDKPLLTVMVLFSASLVADSVVVDARRGPAVRLQRDGYCNPISVVLHFLQHAYPLVGYGGVGLELV